MRRSLVLWSATSALAGFLFGFDTVVISGAEQKIQAIWHLSAGIQGIAIGAALYGTVIGALTGGYPTDRFGRRATLLMIGVLYLLGALGSSLATNVGTFIVARVIGGLGIGISTVAAPLYIAEIAPAGLRGRLAGMFQFNIVFGILIAFLSNALLARVGENAWRWMLGVAAVPSLVYTLLCLTLPESPRWLMVRAGRPEAGRALLRRIRPEASQAAIEAQAQAILSASTRDSGPGRFWSRRLRKPILLGMLIAFFNQMSGINAILYFAPRIFRMTGLGAHAALLDSVGIGLTNLVFTFIGLWLIDRIGRRTLLFIGSIGYIVSLLLVSWAFYTARYALVPPCIFSFIAAHAVGQGAVIWVYISEIFPNRYRAEGQSLGSFTHWTFAALLTSFFPEIVSVFPTYLVFGFFALMMMLQLLWVLTMVVETKGVPLEEIQRRLGIQDDATAAGVVNAQRY
ncbi:MAG: sugar porter family MFS transporter [Steroidobacteraceae bacterium]|nr:sugar porter family MFS transporter [Steroidobacteraceae bacterium]